MKRGPVKTLIEWDAPLAAVECPVEDGTHVTLWLRNGGVIMTSIPEFLPWSDQGSTSIVAYMVMEEQEPREFWVNAYPAGFSIHTCRENADANAAPMRTELIHVKEVMRYNGKTG